MPSYPHSGGMFGILEIMRRPRSLAKSGQLGPFESARKDEPRQLQLPFANPFLWSVDVRFALIAHLICIDDEWLIGRKFIGN